MPRIERGIGDNIVYHVINRGNGRQEIFHKDKDYEPLLIVLRYIEGNPVRAKLVSSAVEWPWSSHSETVGRRQRVLTDKCPLELPADWTRYVEEPLTEKELEKVRESVNRQAPYGDDDWRVAACREYGLESTVRKRGRPMKGEQNHGKK